MLEVGNFGWDASKGLGHASNALATVESRSHFGAWCIVSSPLILGLDVTDADRMESVWDVISNREAIAVNQAWAGHPGRLVRSVVGDGGDGGGVQVWAKALSGGAQAVLAVNRGEVTANFSVSLVELGLGGGAAARGRDIWARANFSVAEGGSWEVVGLGEHDSAFVTLTPL